MPPVRLTVTSVAQGRWPSTKNNPLSRITVAVTETVVAPASSATLDGLTDSWIALGSDSSSRISSTVADVFDGRPSALSPRITVSTNSSSSRISSSVGVNVKFAVPLVWLAGIVTVKGSTAA